MSINQTQLYDTLQSLTQRPDFRPSSFMASWMTMLPLLMTVLLASAGTVFALRRRSDHDSCSLPTGKGQEDNESSYR